MFKIGDKVKRIKDFHCGMDVGDVGTIHHIAGRNSILFKEYPGSHDSGKFELFKEVPTMKKEDKPIRIPHVHAKLIHKWASDPSIEIEYRDGCGKWKVTDAPTWDTDTQYRIKSEPKPDIIVNAMMQFKNAHKTPFVFSLWNGDIPAEYQHQHNIKGLNMIQFIIDGETDKLKSISIIK